MIVDWDSNERTVYPSGTYKVIIDDWTRGESGTKKTPYVLCKSKIVEPIEHKDRTITSFFYLTEAAIWRLIKIVVASGVDSLGKTDTSSPQFDLILNQCKGRSLYWQVIETKDDKGLPRNEIVDFVNDLEQADRPAQDSAPKVLWDEETSTT